MQTTVTLKRSQAEVLDDLSRQEGRPVDAIVAEAIATLISGRGYRPEPPADLNDPVLRRAFGAWKGLVDENGAPYDRTYGAEEAA